MSRGLQLALKRALDLIVSLSLLVLAAPVMVLTALAVRVSLGRPVLFRQVRPGKNEKLFSVYKYRTMNEARDAEGKLLPDAQRLTPVGRFIRSASLDELPQVWNVLRGEMSLVGPRPLLVEYLPLYNDEQRRRHLVKPGITGWAQINGRNDLSWEEKFQLDVWYVDHWSFVLDLKIIVRTAWKVLRREGISKTGEATTTYFNGSHPEA